MNGINQFSSFEKNSKKMKRYLWLVLILILGAAAGYFYLTDSRINFSRDSAVYKAIPVSAPFFFEIHSIKDFSLNNPIIQDLSEAGIGDDWFDFLLKTDSLIQATENLPKSLLNSPFVLTWGYSGRNELVPLIIVKAETDPRKNTFQALLESLYSPVDHMYNEREYGRHIITEIADGSGNKGSVFYTFSD